MVEHEIFRNLTFQTGYAGAHDTRPTVNLNANASPPGTGSAGGILSQRYGANYTGTINELVPFQSSQYDSMQTKVNYRMAGGSSAGFAWTWSKAINYADNEDLGFVAFPYPANWQMNRAPAGFDRKHNFEIWSVFALPFGKDQRWIKSGVGGWLLGGWLVDPVISYLTGLPFTVTSSSPLNANGATETADLVGRFRLTNGKPPRTGQTCLQDDPSCHYFEASDFAAPLITKTVPAHFGNTGRNQFRGPGFFNMNLSVLRDFRLTERFTLEVRADAFGLTNTPHFANPNLGCPGSGGAPGPVAGSGGLCDTGSNNNFGVITGTAQPGGFFGPDPGNRTVWFGATVKF